MKILVGGFGILTVLTLAFCYLSIIFQWSGTTNLIELLKVLLSWQVLAGGAAALFNKQIRAWLNVP